MAMLYRNDARMPGVYAVYLLGHIRQQKWHYFISDGLQVRSQSTLLPVTSIERMIVLTHIPIVTPFSL